MTREDTESQLNRALAFVEATMRYVLRQQDIVARLEEAGEDATEARRLLENFARSHRAFKAQCDRLNKELNAKND